MISFVRGVLAVRDSAQVIVDVNGVGYSIDIGESTKSQLPEVGSETIFYTHYHCRENEVKLYGFASRDELKVFETALVVKGVGPSLALNIVSKLSPAEFQRAIREGDHATLMRVPRLNKELAQLMIMKLKNAIRKIHFDAKVDDAGSGEHTETGVKVLVGLGASESAAERAIADAQKILGPTAKQGELLRLALARLNQ
jgi:Holliday junction DNA helicase RuvA